MIIRSYPPKEFHRGLYVTYRNDHNDFYMSTDFNLVLDEPTAPVSEDVMQTCAKLFTLLLTGDLKRDVISYGGNMVTNLMSFSYSSYIRKDDALDRVVQLCNQFLDKESFDEVFLAALPAYDKASEHVRTFLTDITENGKYEYEEDIT